MQNKIGDLRHSRISRAFGEQHSIECRQVLTTSAAQRALWFAQKLNPSSRSYKLAEYLEIRGPVDETVFEVALRQVVEEAENLHAVFIDNGGAPLQICDLPIEWHFPILDFSTSAGPTAEANSWMQSDMMRLVHLDQGPLFSFALLKIADDRYFFYQCAHHIVIDAFSGALFTQRLAEVYSALVANIVPPPCPFDKLRYLIEVDSAYEASDAFQRDREYWMAHLADMPLPVSLAWHQGLTSTGTISQRRRLSEQTNTVLRELAKKCGTTLPQLLVALISIYLHRITGQTDLVIGFAVTARTNRSTRKTPGMVANVVPLRLVLTPDLPLNEILTQVKKNVREYLKHQRYRAENLRSELGLAGKNQPLYATSINILPFDFDFSFAGHAATIHTLSFGPTEDLIISICDHGDAGGIEMCLDASSALHTEEEILRHINRFVLFLRATLHNPELQIGEIEMLSAEERSVLLVERNATTADYPSESCIHELFERQATLTPDAVAVVFGDAELSYGALNARANSLAHHLKALGIGPDDRVAICAERSREMVVGLLGILKAGGAYVPLDPSYPPERLAYMLEDAAPVAVLRHGEAASELAMPGLPVVNLGEDDPWRSCPPINPDRDGLTSRHLAYVIYTSGSTGLPKGVMVEHRGLVNLAQAQKTLFDLSSHSRVVQFASLSFDASAWEIVMALSSGASLYLPNEIQRSAVLDYMASNSITHATLPPAMLHGRSDLTRLTSVSTVILAGEKPNAGLVHALQGQSTVFNAYGPTESTVCATVWECPANVGPAVNIPIGRPISNTRIYLLDGLGLPVPSGAVGEIYIGGAGVARGYLNRPELTAERFLLDPFSPESGARMYRTGDLARYLPDGNIEFLGRKDFQVKIRGFRIELGEIEARLGLHEDVGEAVVVAREDGEGGKRLVVYYTGAAEAGTLRSHLQACLPDYMVPSAYVPLAALPLTPNGKLDRKALPAPEGDAYAHTAYEAPNGPVEEALAAIWRDLLGVDRIGRHDNFFALGGHSLLAVQLISRMDTAGFHVDVRALFGHPTLMALANAMGDATTVAVPANAITADRGRIEPWMLPLVDLSQDEIDRIVAGVPGGASNVQDIYPLAPLQEGVLYHYLSAERGDPYLLQACLAFDSRERLEGVLEALQAVIARHDILRTAIVWEGLREPVQVVHRQARLPVEEVRLDPAEGDIAGQLAARFDAWHHRLDVRRAPLMAAKIAEDASHGRWVALLLLHHLVEDATSVRTLMGEIAAHLLGEAARLPVPVPYRNYVAQSRLGTSRERDEAFFREMLGSVDEPTLPYGLSEVQGGSGIVDAVLPVETGLAGRLRARASHLGVSAASLFHLAWGHVLGRLSDREDVVFGTVLLGRMQGASERSLGMFINTLPLRLELGENTVADAVRQTQARLAGLLLHEHASLALAQRCSGVPAPLPLFSALLNYRHSAGEAVALGSLSFPLSGVELLGGEERTNYPLTLSVDDLGEGFGLTVQAVPSVDAARVGGYVHEALSNLVKALEEAPDRLVRELEILSAGERSVLLVERNATSADYPSEFCIHALFERQAAMTPDAVAVVSGDEELGYGALNARANCLAHHLKALGAGPDHRVAILLDRSIELVVAELAVLKCGASYVPLDRNVPASRQAFMLEDCGAGLVLTVSNVPMPETMRAKRIDLDRMAMEDSGEISASVPVHSTAPAYVMYTSGSTGQPKGVVVPHRAVVRLVVNNGYADFRPDDRVAFASNPAFDATTMEVWGPLLHGGSAVVIDQATMLAPEKLIQSLKDKGITTLFLTTALFNHCAAIPKAFSCLRLLLTGGERSDPSSFRKVIQEGPQRLVHCYGPTETTTFALTYETLSVPEGISSIPIGRPISNTRIYLLDEHGLPVPSGAVGEIYIGGAGVARGYLNRPELTAERFLLDPFSPESGARMYRTGDLARYLPDGNIEFLGRLDFQVKIRGLRIELGEIEAQLLCHSDVGEAVVVAREDGEGGKRLVVYYTGAAEAGTLRSHLQACLPDYMVPSAYVPLAAFPLTPNGKLDRKALPAPEGDAYAHAAYEAPNGPVEEALAAIWRDLLGVDRIGRHDNFFALGGHSLLIVRLVSWMKQKGIETHINDVFKYPTIAEFARCACSNGPANLEVLNIRSSGSRRPLFLAHEGMGVDAYFYYLAPYIDTDIPVYGLPTISEDERQLHTIEEMAARCVKLIRVVQQQGPYRIAGWSFGGVLAYEIATQLVGQNQDVEFVGLIDSIMPVANREKLKRWLENSSHNRQLLELCGISETSSVGKMKATHMPLIRLAREISFEALLEKINDMKLIPPFFSDMTSAQMWRFFDRSVTHVKALLDYPVYPIPAPTYIFAAEEREENEIRSDDWLGWRSIIHSSTCRIQVPGNHQTMITDHSSTLGKAITQAINEVERRAFRSQ